MSIGEQINRLQGAKAGLKTALERQGLTVEAWTKIDEYPAMVSALNGGDWLELPDISQETGQKAVALLHIRQDRVNRYGFYVSHDDTVENRGVSVDWGDGSTETEPIHTSEINDYYYHEYAYDTVAGPELAEGGKQVTVTITEKPGAQFTWKAFGLGCDVAVNDVARKSAKGMLRALAVQAGAGNDGLAVDTANARYLKSVKAYGIKEYLGTLNYGLSELLITGENIEKISATYSNQLEKIAIPAGCGLQNVNFLQSGIQEFEADMTNVTSTATSFASCYRLRKLKLNGITRKFTLTTAPMTREAIVELFQSLGQADMSQTAANRTLTLTSLPGYADLTEEDKQIATDKGFLIS